MNPLIPNAFTRAQIAGAALDAALRHDPGAPLGNGSLPLPAATAGLPLATGTAAPPLPTATGAVPMAPGTLTAGAASAPGTSPQSPGAPAGPLGAPQKPAVTYAPTPLPSAPQGASYTSTPGGAAAALPALPRAAASPAQAAPAPSLPAAPPSPPQQTPPQAAMAGAPPAEPAPQAMPPAVDTATGHAPPGTPQGKGTPPETPAPRAAAPATPQSPRAASPEGPLRAPAGPIASPPQSTPAAVTRWAIEVGQRLLDVPGRPTLEPLGATMYTFLAGRTPPDQPARQAALARQQPDPLLPLGKVREDVPPALERTVHRLMALAPAERFETVRDALDALENTLPEGGKASSMHRTADASVPAPDGRPDDAPQTATSAAPLVPTPTHASATRAEGDPAPGAPTAERPPPPPSRSWTSPADLSNLLPLLAHAPPIPPAVRVAGPAVFIVALWLVVSPELPPLEVVGGAILGTGIVWIWRRLHRNRTLQVVIPRHEQD